MKQRVFRITSYCAVILILMSLALPALAGTTCPYCGAYADDNNRFCANCGKQLGGSSTGSSSGSSYSASGLSITSASVDSNGFVDVRWNDPSNNGPYSMVFIYCATGDYNTDSVNQIRWDGGSNIYSKYNTIEYMAPGYTYWLVVYDKSYNAAIYKYSVPYSRYSQFGINIEMTLKEKNGTSSQNVSYFSASDLGRMQKDFGAYIKLTYSKLAKARHHQGKVVITDPYGVPITDSYFTQDFNAGKTYTYWNFYNFSWYIARVKEQYGYIPTGEYTWQLYLDGQYVNCAAFRVYN